MIIYVGSSGLGLDKLETNHRNAGMIRGYTMTKFRKALKDDWKFEWLVTPAMRTELQILDLEAKLIMKYLPRYNEQYDTVGAKRGNLDMTYKYRGVYGVEFDCPYNLMERQVSK